MNAQIYSPSLDETNASVIALKGAFDMCRLCVDKSNEAQARYIQLQNDAKAKRTALLQMVSDANHSYINAVSMQDKFNFVLSRQNIDPLIQVRDTASLGMAIRNLKLSKDQLNAKLSDGNWNATEVGKADALLHRTALAKGTVDALLLRYASPLSESVKTIEVRSAN